MADEITRAPSDNTTVLDVLEAFAADGYAGNVGITDDGLVRCPSCREEAEPTEVRLDQIRRLEGASDPDDMVAVLGMACPHCGERGAVVVKYGPTAGPGDTALLVAIEDARGRSPSPSGPADGSGPGAA